jgi:hypothetical protein
MLYSGVQRLLSKYVGATTGQGRSVEADYDEKNRRLTLWWLDRRGTRSPTPVTIIVSPTDGHFTVTTLVDLEAPRTSREVLLNEACLLVDAELAKH